LLAAVLIAGGCSATRDPRGSACGFSDEPIAAQFGLIHARDYRLHLPGMGRSPELEHDRPAFVVVFAGSLPRGLFGGYPPLDPDGKLVPQPPPDPQIHDVVCVVVDGAAIVYADVDSTGLNDVPWP
jgi:hypothetical protein